MKILFCCGFIHIWQLHNCYILFTELVDEEVDINLVIVMSIWIVYHIVKVLILILMPPECKKLHRKIKMRIGFYENEDTHQQEVCYFLCVIGTCSLITDLFNRQFTYDVS